MFFRDEFEFLSNFSPCVVRFNGKDFPTSEHLYQSFKTEIPEEVETIRLAATPGKAKRLGQLVTLRSNWESMKDTAMTIAVCSKFFQHSDLLVRLSQVEGEIVEDNTWGDTTWGRVDGVGENRLGKILMMVRDMA